MNHMGDVLLDVTDAAKPIQLSNPVEQQLEHNAPESGCAGRDRTGVIRGYEPRALPTELPRN